MEGYILDCSEYKQDDNYVTTTNRIAEYMGAEYNQGVYIRSTIENKKRYTIPRPADTVTTSTTTENEFDTMSFNMELDAYANLNYMLEENTQKVHSLVLRKCTDLKKKPKQSKGWSEAYTKFYFLKLIKIIKSIIFKFEDHKYLAI